MTPINSSMVQSSGTLMSCAGGPVGKGLGTLICRPFCLAQQADCCLGGAGVKNALVGARMTSNVKIDLNCFIVYYYYFVDLNQVDSDNDIMIQILF